MIIQYSDLSILNREGYLVNNTCRVHSASMQKLFLFLVVAVLFSGRVFAQTASLAKTFLTSVQTTPWGILAGEKDTRLWLTPFNGLYISKDLGTTWQEFNLKDRGVTDIEVKDNIIYVSTYYFVNATAGLFNSQDGGANWTHLCNNFSTSAVAAAKDTILIGTYSQGLWMYSPADNTCVQKLPGPEILAVAGSDTVALASVAGKTYISYDDAQTWTELTYLNGKTIKSMLLYKNIVLACGDSGSGLFRSTDLGVTWQKVSEWGNYSCGGMTQYKDVFYAGKDLTLGIYAVFSSGDFGLTWQTGHNTDALAKDISWVYSRPSYLFELVNTKGIYKFELPQSALPKEPFLDLPWSYTLPNELLDKITAFFDHEYPLLGYYLYPEPPLASATTLNFLGMRSSEPYMYYSSHDGIDFGLPYGSPIIAPAGGTATYYYCKDCGNTIKLDHKNGYQSIYMHLQKQGLITTGNLVDVTKGTTLGLIGLTGRTTGPHLHFGVNKDLNANGLFTDDYPSGKTDPFGWQDTDLTDPWATYSWSDTLGTHSGTQSSYLWTILNSEESVIVNETPESRELTLDNKVISIQKTSSEFNYTVFLKNYVHPLLPDIQKNLAYIPNTSFLISASDLLGQKIEDFNDPITIKITLGTNDLTNVITSTLHIYFWNELSALWETLDTSYDESTNTLTTETTHFSHFAVFGEKTDTEAPTTQLTASGQMQNGWYIEYPLVTLQSESAAITVYSLDNGDTWETYTAPIVVEKDGFIRVLYKSIDENENMEQPNESLLKINTQNRWKKQIKVIQAIFSTQ